MERMAPDKNQRAVVVNRCKGNLLVSASAGAGKTKVLVDRVVNELIQDPSLGIGNLLIVTFTRAAAKQMMTRIRRKLQKKISIKLYPNRDRLLQQIQDLPTANIGTLDSFCQKIVEHYYYVIGMDPHFRILNDNSDMILLRDQVWKNVREDLYTKNSKAFKQLVANTFSKSIKSDDELTDPLTNLVYQLYDSVMIAPDQDAWRDNIKQAYTIDDSLKQSYLYRHILQRSLTIRVNQILSLYKSLMLAADDAGLTKDYNLLENESKSINTLKDALDPKDGTWDELRKHFLDVNQILSERIKPVPKKATSDMKQAHKDLGKQRTKAKNKYKKIVSDYFMFDETFNKKIINHTSSIINELLAVVDQFKDAYGKTKAKRHVMEFIDIEQAALQILKKSKDVRKQLQSNFHEIMIDEYQDDNELQDAIINMIAKHNPKTQESTNVFMVGDVKQSIYRFRSADPKLFIQKYKDYKQPNPNDNQEITLSKNYRSTQNIDRFVNLIFEQIMDEQFGKINYSDQIEQYGAVNKYSKSKVNTKVPVNLLIYNEPKNYYHSSVDDVKQIKNPIKDSTDGQIEMVAQVIRALVNNPHHKIVDTQNGNQERMIHYQDIALIASTRNDNSAISNVFRRYKIPVQLLGSQNYFRTTEIQIMLSLLEVIDNPHQDIPLAAVLRSPMVGLNENQLAYLRINDMENGKVKTDYYHAVKKFNDHYQPQVPGKVTKKDRVKAIKLNRLYKKVHQFLDHLSQFRKITQRHGLVDLIWNIYQVTGFLDYVGGMPAGTQRQANLHALYERAADYEEANLHGLFQFVHFIHQLQNQQKDLAQATPQQSKNMVTAVTIHGSKGLEFPIVFLMDTSRGFNQTDLKNQYVLSNNVGLGLKYFSSDLKSELTTLPFQGLIDYELQNDLAEEMRKLYVALTRTEQCLFVIGKATDTKGNADTKQTLFNHWNSLARSSDQVLNLADRLSAKDYLDWIGSSLIRLPRFKRDQIDLAPSNQLLDKDQTNFRLAFADNAKIYKNRQIFSPNTSVKIVPGTLTNKDKSHIQNVMTDFHYAHQAATEEGNYRSVTDVKQLFEDPNDIEMGQLDQTNHDDHHGLSNQYVTGDFTTPKFIQDDKEAKPKATDIGTATHLVLQMVNIEGHPDVKELKRRIADKITELKKDQMIDSDVATKINQYNILQFFINNPYGKAVLQNPKNYHRETPFSLLMSAHIVLPEKFSKDSSERILIHGIIDGYLYDNDTDQASIVDYKTDYVDFNDKQASIKKIKDRYRGQLNLYGIALSSVIGHPVKHKYLYLLSCRQLVEL